MRRIGLIGCGVVGSALGARLLRAGFELHVHDRHPEKLRALVAGGAVASADAAVLGAGCEAVVSALPRAADIFEALTGPAGAWTRAPRGLVHIDTSTIGVAAARTLAATAAQRGVRYLDAPLSAAEPGETRMALAIFVAGNADHYDLALPVLEALADHVHFLGGPPGAGQVAKLVNNLVSHSFTIVLADALAMGLKAGLPIELLRAALHDGTAQSRVLDDLLPPSAFRGNWRPGLTLDLALKDLALAEELARETGVDQHLLATVRSIYEEALRRGWGGLSSHSVVRLQEEASGVSFRSAIFEKLGAPQPMDDDEAS